ncbi:UNVERIFIED_CONTAM: hypothetical protein GTU68_023215 [Idotea baltica]|nr:hypothetical protein [Idotea baltica]
MSKTILVTNDDGISANGIKALVDVAKEFGQVVVVAPDKPQSAMGHAITIKKPLRIRKTDMFDGIEAYACSGTPVDCVKLAVDKILGHQHPDLCLSGINHGSNASINIIYSGTMSAAMEGAIEGIPSIGFSLDDFSDSADFKASKHYIRQIINVAIGNGFPASKLLNVNIPKGKIQEIKGMQICRQAKAFWKEEFDERTDPFGEKYYWLTGKFINQEENVQGTDIEALTNGYVSIVPVQYDLTSYTDLEMLSEKWNF